MGRRQRQLDELRALCGAGAVARAVDLAFAYVADFGRDDEVVTLLTEAVARAGDEVRARFAALLTSCG